MVLAVDQRDRDVDNREADQRTGGQHRHRRPSRRRGCIPSAPRRRRLRDSKSLPTPGAARADLELDRGELARAARLLLVGIGVRDRLGDRLAVGDLRRADADVDLVGALQDVDLDVEVQFAHPLEDGLAALLVGRDAERRVLRGKPREGDAELLLVGLGLRLDRDLDDRVGEFHLLEDHRLLRVAERVAGAGFLEAGQRDDVAGIGFLGVLAVVGMHEQHPADALLAVARRIEDLLARPRACRNRCGRRSASRRRGRP